MSTQPNSLRGALLGIALATSAIAGMAAEPKPTVILVHGAFAESSSWNGVAARLIAQGYPVIAVANPLRGVKGDAVYVRGTIDAVGGPVVLVGHSYGGSVITNAAWEAKNVKALVYVAAFAPDVGETAFELAGRFPGATLGQALALPVALADGGNDLYIRQDKFRAQFAADVSDDEAKLMAATQRPIREAAGGEASGPPAWKTVPSYFIYGSLDKNIPFAAQAFMAQRAGSRRTVRIEGASHVVMTSHPDAVARLVTEAAEMK
jgi:pimeloyl-ACP methyl ester carboxylesterase